MNEPNIKMNELFKFLLKKWKVIVSITVILGIISYVYTFFIVVPKYQSSSKLFIGAKITKDDDDNFKISTVDNKVLNMYTEIIKTEVFLNNIIKEKELNTTYQEILSGISIKVNPNVQTISISYTGSNRYEVRDVVQAVSDELVKELEPVIYGQKVQVVQNAYTPNAPISPNKKKNLSIGILLGIIIGCFIETCVFLMNDKVDSEEKLEDIFGLSSLGEIPNNKKYRME